jgi:hypothetical protein
LFGVIGSQLKVNYIAKLLKKLCYKNQNFLVFSYHVKKVLMAVSTSMMISLGFDAMWACGMAANCKSSRRPTPEENHRHTILGPS